MFSTQKSVNMSGFVEVIHLIHILIPHKVGSKKRHNSVKVKKISWFTKNYVTMM